MLEYLVPFTQSAEVDGDFNIEGIAINETTTSNGHKFIGEELRKSASTLVNVPLLKDHDNSVDSIVGKVKTASFNEESRNIPFKAIIKDAKMIQMVRDGLLNSVSVGAHVDPRNIEEDDEGNIVPHGIVFKELSLVAVPADSGATFDIALNNAYSKIKSHSNENNNIIERGEKTMTEEKIENESVQESEETIIEAKLKAVTLELKKKELAMLEKKLAESDVDEEAEVEKEAEPEAEAKVEAEVEAEEEAEVEGELDEVEESAYVLTQGHNSFTIERKSYRY